MRSSPSFIWVRCGRWIIHFWNKRFHGSPVRETDAKARQRHPRSNPARKNFWRHHEVRLPWQLCKWAWNLSRPRRQLPLWNATGEPSNWLGPWWRPRIKVTSFYPPFFFSSPSHCHARFVVNSQNTYSVCCQTRVECFGVKLGIWPMSSEVRSTLFPQKITDTSTCTLQTLLENIENA